MTTPTKAENPSAPYNEPAFPQSISPDGPFGGMTLRDWFAGQVAQGMMASEAGIDPYSPEWLAERAYILANALLAQRSKQP